MVNIKVHIMFFNILCVVDCMFMSSKTLYVEILIPNKMVSGGRAFEKYLE